jgi:hypothetical protein
MTSRRLRRLLDAAVLGRLAPRKRSELVAHLRSDEALRSEYDRAIEAFRVLEGTEVARWEYDLVEGWLFEDGAVADVTGQVHSGWLRFVGVIVALAVGLVLALGPLRPQGPDLEEDFGVKHGAGVGTLLAIQALCPRRGGGALVPASQEGCELSGTLSFAYRLDPRASAIGILTLFAVDEHGDVLYYQPTPVDVEPVPAVPGSWQPLPIAVELPVNHEAGAVTLYGLVSPQLPSIEDIDEAGALLGAAAPARLGDPPWHVRLRGRGRIGMMCAGAGACESAELSFYIHEDGR